MAKGSLTNIGIGEWIAGSFQADLAALWDYRVDQIVPSSNESHMRTSRQIQETLKELAKTNSPEEAHRLMETVRELITEIENVAIICAYKAGFHDGARMIMQSVMG